MHMIRNKEALALRAARSARDAMFVTALSTVGLGTFMATEALGQTAAPADQPASPKKPARSDVNELIVTGKAAKTDSVTNIPVALVDTTQSVTVLTQEDIALSGITNWNELGRVESGGYEPGSRGGFTRSYYRGFTDSSFTNNAIKIDGFRSDAQIVPEFFLYDSIQVIKGSAATNFGESSPGGTTVAISKSPKSTFGGTASVEAGSYDHYLANIDIYGPLTADGKLSGRFVGVSFTERSPFDYLGEKRYTLAPSLRYKFTENDELLFISSYSRSEAGASLGFPLAFNANGPGGATNQANYTIPDLKFSQLGDSAPWARIDKNYANMSLTYNHRFQGGFWDGWKLKVALQHNDINTPDSKWAWVGAFNTITTDKTKPTNIYLYWGVNKNHQWAGEVNLLGDVQLLGHTQSFAIGGDYTQNTQGYHPYIGKFVAGATYGFNLYQNNWSVLPGGYSSSQEFVNKYGPPSFSYQFDYKSVDYGEEAQVLLRPIDNLTINLGGRFSFSELDSRFVFGYPADITTGFPPYALQRPDEKAFTYQTGATYALPTPAFLGHVSAYVSYGTTFDAGASFAYDPTNPDGRFLGIVKGRTYEGGLKGESSNAGASYNWSLDYFDTAVTNVFQRDPDHPRFSLAIGAEQATGWEYEFHGHPMPGWVLLLSASSTWNVYTGGALKGINSPFAPRFGVSTWSTYEFQDGPLKGIGFGAGWVHKTRAYYQTYDGMEYKRAFRTHVDEYDARIFYNAKPWLIDLSFTNLFDEHYASAEAVNGIGYYIFENLPTMAMAKITRSF